MDLVPSVRFVFNPNKIPLSFSSDASMTYNWSILAVSCIFFIPSAGAREWEGFKECGGGPRAGKGHRLGNPAIYS